MRIRTEKLCKTYKSRTEQGKSFYACRDVEITLAEGETVGLLATAGAGNQPWARCSPVC